jgi:tetratricopeptide (TPR) repeat protein
VEVKKAEQDVADAKKAAAEAKDDADKKVTLAKAEADKLVAAKLADSVKAQDLLNAKIRAEQLAREADQVKFKKDLAAEVENMKKEMATREERFSLLLAQARAGGPVPLTTGEKAAKERAGRVFGTGVVAFEAGLFDNAEAAFESATKEDPNDARYWYFLGLTRYAKGSTAPADEAFKKGAELESRSKPAASVISASLERVQGPSRRVLAAHRP